MLSTKLFTPRAPGPQVVFSVLISFLTLVSTVAPAPRKERVARLAITSGDSSILIRHRPGVVTSILHHIYTSC
jgi:hypothetical protein